MHLAIDVTAVADSNDQNGERAVADFAQQPVVTHPVTPEIAQRRASQRLSELAGIIKRCEALAQILPDPPGIGRTKTLDLSCGSCCDLNLPGKVRHPARQGTGIARPTCDAQSLPVQQHRGPPLTGDVLRPLRGCRTSRSGLSWRKAPSGGHRFRPEGGRQFVCSFGHFIGMRVYHLAGIAVSCQREDKNFPLPRPQPRSSRIRSFGKW